MHRSVPDIPPGARGAALWPFRDATNEPEVPSPPYADGMMSPRLAVASTLALVLALSACSGGQQPSIAPGSDGTAIGVESATPLPVPTGLPSDFPTEEPPAAAEEAFEEGGATYPRTWPEPTWAAVAVPPAPTPRLDTSCAQLLEAAGRPAGVRLATPQPTWEVIAHRQAGGTACAFRFDLASGPTQVTMLLSADLSLGGSSSPFRCTNSGVGREPSWCYGTVVVGSGSAELRYSVPKEVSLPQGEEASTALLSAVRTVLEAPGTLRPIPAVNAVALGAGTDDCRPSAVQQEAVFSQLDVGQVTDVYGGPLGLQAIDARLDAWACWWFFGWNGVSVYTIPGGGWAVGEPGVLGQPVSVEGADAALLTETPYVENPGFDDRQKVIMRLVVSARGSALVLQVVADPGQEEYFTERMVGVAEAIIATQP